MVLRYILLIVVIVIIVTVIALPACFVVVVVVIFYCYSSCYGCCYCYHCGYLLLFAIIVASIEKKTRLGLRKGVESIFQGYRNEACLVF